MLRTEEEMFGEATVIGNCEFCGEPLCEGFEYYHDLYSGRLFCSEDCVIQQLDLVQVDDDSETLERECLHCGTPLSEEYESIMFREDKHTRWCDLTCCMAYLDIHNMNY